MPVFVLAIDHGYEGHSRPLQAFSDRDGAIAMVKSMRAAGVYGIEAFEVPLWPENPSVPYFNIKPLEIPE